MAPMMIIGACASQEENDEAANSPDCPRNRTMTCYKHTADEEICRCAERGEMRTILEDSIRRHYP